MAEGNREYVTLSDAYCAQEMHLNSCQYGNNQSEADLGRLLRRR